MIWSILSCCAITRHGIPYPCLPNWLRTAESMCWHHLMVWALLSRGSRWKSNTAQAVWGHKQYAASLGALREGDSGLLVSTGGFSREARYEAERANASYPYRYRRSCQLDCYQHEEFDIDGRTLAIGKNLLACGIVYVLLPQTGLPAVLKTYR